MKVYDFEVSEELMGKVRAALAAGPKTKSDLTRLLMDAGVPEFWWEPKHRHHQNAAGKKFLADRVADRILQREKKGGAIKLVDRKWQLVCKKPRQQ